MPELRIAVLGVGVMGADHVARITNRISGAHVAVVNDYLTEKAEQIAASVPGARVAGDPLDAIAADDVDAVLLATPGPAHEKQLLACLEHRKPVLCEKPLTTDAGTSLEVVRREAELGTPLIQVGFMRRFDPEYTRLKAVIDGGELGQPLVMHCVHRNPAVPPSFDSAMVVKDSLVHEVDVTRFLFGEEIESVQIVRPAPNPGAPDGLQDPQIAIFRTTSGRHVDVEVFVTTGVGYEVRAEVIGEHGGVTLGFGQVTPGFRERFGSAYDIELQRWVDAVRSGVNVDGPTAWDGYAAAAVCAAGVRSLQTGERVAVELAEHVGAALRRHRQHGHEWRKTELTKTLAPNTIAHWINNKTFAGTSGNTAPVTNPATGEVTGEVALASVEDARAVIDAAAAAFPAWRDTSLAKRTQILFAFRELLNARKHEVAEIITSEHGKVVSDALGEVSRGQEVVEFACGIPHLLKGGFTENASTKVDVYSIRQPLGPIAIISPFNFPAMVPMWFFPIAVAAGNTVVLKPSEKDPSASLWLADLWAEAGLPPGVFNVLQGDKTAVDELLTNKAIKSVSFVGSTPIASYVYQTGTAAGKRVQALGGAKNHAVILPDADLDLAADAMVNAGFGSAGERCMAISACVAVGPIADDLVAKIAERASTIKTGDGTGDADMGPLVTKAHRDKVASYIDAGEADGAKIVVDGRTVSADGGQDGFWLGPTLIDNVTPEMSVYTDEIFGPVLSVVRVETYDEALDLVNSNPYGNGTAIFTSDGGAARRFQNEVEVGMVGINVPIPVPMAYYSFGGWKASLFGDSHAHGMDGVQFFTRGKAITSRWLDHRARGAQSSPSARGIELGFPQNT